MLGDALGDALGEALGEVLGDALDEAEGDAEGDVLGDVLGEVLGEALGDAIGAMLGAMFGDALPASPVADLSLAEGLRLAVEDLKAFYTEALLAQPATSPNDNLMRWFWEETAAGSILLDLKDICLASGDDSLQLFGNVFLVPRSEVDRAAG